MSRAALSLDRTPMDASEILLTRISVPPGVNGMFFNVPGRGRVKTTRYRAWRTAAGWEALAQKPKPVRGPVEVTITIEDGASKGDIDGLIKGPLDLLVDLNLIDGDGPQVVRRATVAWGNCEAMRIEVRALP